MKLLRYRTKDEVKPGILHNNKIKDLSSVIEDISPKTLDDNILLKIQNLNFEKLKTIDNCLSIAPFINHVGKFICIGLNFSDHAKEVGMENPKEPIIFMKATSAICGPNDDIIIPKNSQKTDWEVELGIVIGKEAKYIETFRSPKRKAEFKLGRICAHEALKRFNLESVPILRNPYTREPCWPESIHGSITHSGNLSAVAVGSTRDISGIGLDLEDLSRKIDFKLRKHICLKDELEWLKKFKPEQANRNLRIIFSAKESIFKCLFPISKTYLHFKDANINVNLDEYNFSYKLSRACSGITEVGFEHKGFFAIKNDFLLTSTYIRSFN